VVSQIRTGHQINSKEIFSMKSILCFCQLAGIQKMKTILTSIAAASLLAGLAVAQPLPSAGPAAHPPGRWTRTTARLSTDIYAEASPNRMVYVVTNGLQFGTEDLRSGAFVPIGPGLPPEDAGVGLVRGPDRSLLTLAFTGDLIGVNPVTGAVSLVGKTGLDDCSTPTSPCGPNSSGFLGRLDGKIYATDFANNLYSLDPTTGATSLIGPTGIPAITGNPNLPNLDGTFNVFDANLFSFRGKLYAIFDGFKIDPNTGASTTIIPGAIYAIDHKTGQAIWIASTALGLTSVVTVGDTVYGFDALTGQIVTVDMSSGQTNAVTQIDPAIIIAVCGATPAPAALGNGG
jgi:outer membrane protein assembly factor BamB